MNKFYTSIIVNIDGSCCEGTNLYMVSEYIEGYTLEERIREQGCVTENEALKIMDQVLEAMQYVHNYNVIRRDLKPSNIMIRKDNGKICLLDFGIAKDMKSKGLTSGMLTIGTNGYLSPEQAEGITIDSRTDIYSLGCVLYYILSVTHFF